MLVLVIGALCGSWLKRRNYTRRHTSMAARHYTDEGAEITLRPWTLTNVSVTRRLSYNLLFYISSRNTNSVKAVSTNFTSLREACPDLPLSNGQAGCLDEKIYDLFRGLNGSALLRRKPINFFLDYVYF